ncbi:hypothetical protein B0J18DRAFT_421686 [Chaetomium sp. MPI-SDFR-AT-0129]|nr:hypothetical protein B0J18DRAFT_421686 [Chaetomium sp. MPI-SDFR-AT-0129]
MRMRKGLKNHSVMQASLTMLQIQSRLLPNKKNMANMIPLKSQANYHRLSSLMKNGSDLAIFRRFGELNMMSLLSLQAEILQLESDYRHHCELDNQSTNKSEAEYAMYFRSLHESRCTSGEQIRLLDALQVKLAAYNSLLLQVAQLSRIDSPEKQELGLLQAWLRDSRGGKNFLDGVEAETWTDPEESNYISVGPPPPEKDIFSSFLRGVLLQIFHFLCGERFKIGRVVDEESGIRSYDDSRIDKASSMITVILASVLPVLAIFVLNSLSTTNARIGTIVGFTAAFATILAVFSSAKRAEIFAATATFAAIEVVYVGTALGNSSSGL